MNCVGDKPPSRAVGALRSIGRFWRTRWRPALRAIMSHADRFPLRRRVDLVDDAGQLDARDLMAVGRDRDREADDPQRQAQREQRAALHPPSI